MSKTPKKKFIFNPHPEIKEDDHAFLAPSNPHWIGYDDAKLRTVRVNSNAARHGEELHAYAADSIRFNQKLLAKKTTLGMFVNDAIGFGMTCEQPLKYSGYCYGRADAIYFDWSILRIHDLKTGKNQASMRQLEIYAALFCLEYRVNPEDIQIELRIYQNDAVVIENPEAAAIRALMDIIIHHDKLLTKIDMEVL